MDCSVFGHELLVHYIDDYLTVGSPGSSQCQDNLSCLKKPAQNWISHWRMTGWWVQRWIVRHNVGYWEYGSSSSRGQSRPIAADVGHVDADMLMQEMRIAIPHWQASTRSFIWGGYFSCDLLIFHQNKAAGSLDPPVNRLQSWYWLVTDISTCGITSVWCILPSICFPWRHIFFRCLWQLGLWSCVGGSLVAMAVVTWVSCLQWRNWSKLFWCVRCGAMVGSTCRFSPMW